MGDPIRQILLKAALSSDPPLLTDDPIVNHMVDMHEDGSVPWNLHTYEEEIYAWKISGGFLLSYRNKDNV
jgi:hypothetical protein